MVAGSAFSGTLAELAFAADRGYMLEMISDPDSGPQMQLSAANFGLFPMCNDLSRLQSRFLGSPERLAEVEVEDVVALDRPFQGRPPPAADIEQFHPRLQSQLAQREVDLRVLSLLQRHVVAFEVGAAVCLGGIQKQPEKVVRQVVMRLNILEVRFEAGFGNAVV